MDWVSSEVVSVLYYLLPGFLAAWVFYGLTAHPRTTPFERVVQALIFTVIVQALTAVARGVLLLLGRIGCLGTWTKDSGLIWSILFALAAGLAFAWIANGDGFHAWLRNRGITTRTSFPSEWFSAFARHKRWIVLHLSGERRLYGWPEEWPDHPGAGHFLIDQPEWLLDSGKRVPLYHVEKTLVPATDVEMVEFVKTEQETSAGPEDL